MAQKNKKTPNKNQKEQKKVLSVPDYVIEKGENAKKAYIEWIKLDEKIHEHPKRFIQVPHPDDPSEMVEIDCIQALSAIRKKIRHLPKKERDKIEAIWKELQSLKAKKGGLKKQWDNIMYKGKMTTLFDYKKSELLQLFGSYKTNSEVYEIIKKDWGYHTTMNKLNEFKMANKERIAELRREWTENCGDFDLAHKRGRLEVLAYIANTQIDEYKESGHKPIYAKQAQSAIEQIKKEVEGEEITLNVKGHVDIRKTLIVNQSIDEVTKRVNFNGFIVAIVSAQRGLNSIKFMNRLANNYYSSYTGFNKKDNNEKEIQYPSKLIYNWNEIELKHKQGELKQDIQDVEYEEINEDDKLRQKLKARIKKRRQELGD